MKIKRPDLAKKLSKDFEKWYGPVPTNIEQGFESIRRVVESERDINTLDFELLDQYVNLLIFEIYDTEKPAQIKAYEERHQELTDIFEQRAEIATRRSDSTELRMGKEKVHGNIEEVTDNDYTSSGSTVLSRQEPIVVDPHHANLIPESITEAGTTYGGGNV